MKGVLVIAHGSRAKETEEVLKTFLDAAAEKVPGACVEHAFMEFGDRNIEKGIAALAEKKVTEIKIIPYFLFSGIHIKEDIPTIVSECMKNYPEIKAVMDEPLGTDKRLADILADRIRE